MPSYSKVAGGNISPCRFVKLSTTVNDQVLQAGAGDKVYGISFPFVRNAPYGSLDDGFNAISGESIPLYGPPDKDVMLELSGTVTAGDSLKSDTNGTGITTTSTGNWVGAIAMESGVTGDIIRVETVPPTQY